MKCPYCGGQEIDLSAESGGSPTAKCAQCGAELDAAALASQVQTCRNGSRGLTMVGGIAGAVLAAGLLATFARPHSRPVPVPARGVSRSVTPASSTVYVTRTGMKFHRSGCSYLREGREHMGRDEAVSRGFTACSVCQP